MASAKDIKVAPISAKDAAAVVKRIHYSGSLPRPKPHLGASTAWLEGLGSPIDKRSSSLAEDTPEWLPGAEPYGV